MFLHRISINLNGTACTAPRWGDGMGLEVRHRIIVFVVMATHGSLSTMLYGEIHNWIQTLPIVPVFSTSHPSILEARVPVIQRSSINIQQRGNSRGFSCCCTGGAITSRSRARPPPLEYPCRLLIPQATPPPSCLFCLPNPVKSCYFDSILRGHFSSLTYQLIKANDDDEREDET